MIGEVCMRYIHSVNEVVDQNGGIVKLCIRHVLIVSKDVKVV